MPAFAADAPPYRSLLQQALASAPTLVEQQADVNAARADALQARAWLNPRLDTVSENIGAPAAGGVSQRQDTVSITQPIEIGGKRAARIEAGDRNLAAADARGRQVRSAFAADLALAYATVEATQARLAVAREDLERAGDDLRAASAQVRAGKEAELRQAQAQASVAASRANEQAAIAEVTQALERLSALSGSVEAYSGVATSLLSQAEAVAAEPAQDDTPAVRSARAERESLAAQLQIEQKRWIPDVGVSLGQRRYAWTDGRGYVVGVSVTIPLFDTNRNAIDAAAQRVAAADARLASARLQGTALRRSAVAQLQAAEQRLGAAGEGERTAKEAYRLSRIGYDAGKTSLVEVLAIRRALSDARTLNIDARLARVRALAALAQADGRLAFGD